MMAGSLLVGASWTPHQRAPFWPKLARRELSSLVSWILGFVQFEPASCPLEVALGRNSYKFWDIPRPRALSG